MTVDTAQLASEIANDPAGLGLPALAQAKNWGGIAAALNAPSPSRSKSVPRVPIASVLMWAAGGPLEQLAAGSTNSAVSAQIRSICRACLLIFSSPATQTLDLGDQRNLAMLAALVQAGVFSASDQTNCLALVNVSPASRAEELWGDGASVSYDLAHIASTQPWGTF